MSRSGYSDDYYDQGLNCWRGAVASALRGHRGQAFLRELVTALDALPEKKLAANSLVSGDGCCALGAVAIARRLNVDDIEGGDRWDVAERFGIAEAMAAEIMYENDEGKPWRLGFDDETPEQRWERMRRWAVSHIELREDELL